MKTETKTNRWSSERRAESAPAMLLIALLLITTAARAQFGGGTGTQGDPYIISTTDHMTALANNVNGGNSYLDVYFRLDADLDYTSKSYIVIGDRRTDDSLFGGKFNGNGHTISGITLNKTDNETNSINVGLFGVLFYQGSIENLTLSNSTIKGRYFVGGIVGEVWSGTIQNCHVTNDVTIETVYMFANGVSQPSGSVGGIVGSVIWNSSVKTAQIINCTSAANIKASSNSECVGGILGFTDSTMKTTITGCTYTGTISGGAEYVGGIAGQIAGNESTFSNNYVGGNCTLGAVGVAGSTQGTDEGYNVTHLYTVGINWAQVKEGTIDTPPTMTVNGTGYYSDGIAITLSRLNTFGTPAGGGMMWNYHAFIDYDNYVEVLPQENGTWQFTMPAANVTINPSGAKDIRLTEYPYTTNVTLTPATAAYTDSGQKPTVGIVCRTRDLTEGTDFITDIPAAGFTSVGDHTFHIWGIGDYGGLRTETFTIERAPLTTLTLSESSVYYDGEAHAPTLTVKAGSKTLTRGTDYETDLPAGGFTDLGEHTINVWGVGNYTGDLSATFTICHPWEGMGTQQAPFLIKNTDDMVRLASFVNGGKNYLGVYFRQAANLDFTGKTYTPIANNVETSVFQGTYDGYSFTITGISVSGHPCTGVFGNVGTNATIRSVTLTGSNTFVGNSTGDCGSIAAVNRGRVESCSVAKDASGTVTIQGSTAGGIVGVNYSPGTVTSCINYAATVDANLAGGIVGLNSSGNVDGMNYATVSGDTAGGICGTNMLNGTVMGQHYGSVSGTICGGIVGDNRGTIEYSLSNDLMASVREGSDIGAIVGVNGGVLTCNYYIGACKFGGVRGNDEIGRAMRGWPISHDENISFMPLPNAWGNIIGTYYDDGTNNYYYVGKDEKLRFMLSGGTGYTANGTTLAVAGHNNDYDEDYFELTMPATQVHITPTGLTLTLYDNWVNAHNEEDIAEANGKTRTVTLANRTLYKDGKWNTLCLPFNVTDGDDSDGLTFSGTPIAGATARTLTSASITGTTLNLTFGDPVETIEAGKPYIIKWDKDTANPTIDNPTFSGVTIDAADRSYDNAADGDLRVRFLGTYKNTKFNAEDRSILFIGGSNTLYYPMSGASIGACRAYFKIGDDGSALARQLTAFNIGFGDGEETTGITTTNITSSGSAWYSLDGRRLNSKPTKNGVYINNGRKIVIK